MRRGWIVSYSDFFFIIIILRHTRRRVVFTRKRFKCTGPGIILYCRRRRREAARKSSPQNYKVYTPKSLIHRRAKTCRFDDNITMISCIVARIRREYRWRLNECEKRSKRPFFFFGIRLFRILRVVIVTLFLIRIISIHVVFGCERPYCDLRSKSRPSARPDGFYIFTCALLHFNRRNIY